MKTIIHITAIILAFATLRVNAQGYESTEITETGHGKTLNISAGSGYLLYAERPMLYGNINYEMGIGDNITLGPSVSFFTYKGAQLWGNELTPPRMYGYREMAIPLALRGSYYFDNLFDLVDRWDVYAGGSLGYVVGNITWDKDYSGNKAVIQRTEPFFANAHLGTRYHLTNRLGVFAEASSMLSGALGLSVKF